MREMVSVGDRCGPDAVRKGMEKDLPAMVRAVNGRGVSLRASSQ